MPRHDHQQIVEVMRDTARQLTERIHLLRLSELALDFLQPQLGLTPFADVPGNLGKTDQAAIVITDRIDDHARPEEGTVLADTPALLLISTSIRRDRQRARAGRPAARSTSV